jgi:hypothetical protein
MMDEMASMAEKLRQVRDAQELFLSLWATEQMTVMSESLDRLADDVADTVRMARAAAPEPPDFADPNNPPPFVHRRGFLDD